jgi:geranylgeranyl pyrophosphate synthase
MKTARFDEVRELCLPAIEAHLEAFFDEARRDGLAMNAEMARYHFSTGGKRLRALIPCWVYAAYGRDPLEGVPLGCALEMVHNATLVHDDLQDGDIVRRGKPTVWKQYSPAQAINCGDALFQFALQMLGDLRLEPAAFKRVTRRVVRGTLEVIEGQAQEFVMKEEAFPGVARYLGVVEGKTAALISTALVSALEALGQTPELCDRADRLTRLSGILFQLQDDILDVYGDKQRDRRATDIAEGKVSVLVALFNEAASPEHRDEVAAVLRTPREKTSDAQISRALELFDFYRIKEASLARLRGMLAEIEGDPVLARQPELQGLLLRMSGLFLEPISSLLNSVRSG